MGKRKSAMASSAGVVSHVNGEDVFWCPFQAVVWVVREGALRRACQVLIGADLSNSVADLTTADGAAVIKAEDKGKQ